MRMPKISIVIPCRNEERFIARCIDSLLAQDHPDTEIFIVDGMSTDKTREIVHSYHAKDDRVRLLDNPGKTTQFGMNVGAKAATGEYVMIGGAHATYAPNHISKCLHYMKEYGADCAGGMVDTLPAKNTLPARAIALALRSRLGAGGSDFRTGAKKPVFADAVFGILIKRELFHKVGYFNEKMTRSQDIEFNKRLIAHGAKILLVPEVKVPYYPKPTYAEFWQHNLADGAWAIIPWKYGANVAGVRHLIPLAFVLSLGASLILGTIYPLFRLLFFVVIDIYFIVTLWYSFAIGIENRAIALIPHLFIAFLIRHFGYGIGSLIGFWKLIASK